MLNLYGYKTLGLCPKPHKRLKKLDQNFDIKNSRYSRVFKCIKCIENAVGMRYSISEVVSEPSYASALLRDAAEVDNEVFQTPEEMFESWESEA